MAGKEKPAVQSVPEDGVILAISADVLKEIAHIEIADTAGVAAPQERESHGMFRRHGSVEVSLEVSGQDVVYQVRFGVRGGARIPEVATEVRQRIAAAVHEKTGHVVRAVHVLVNHVAYDEEGASEDA